MKSIHFVQSLETLEGGGLGISAKALHQAMLEQKPNSSYLITTGKKQYIDKCENIYQGKRIGPNKLFYAPSLVNLTKDILKDDVYIHGHGFYVWTNFWLGRIAQRTGNKLVYHPHGFFDPWILNRSKGKKAIANILFENKNIKMVDWWRAVTNKEVEQIKGYTSTNRPIHVIPNGIDLDEVDSTRDRINDIRYHPLISNQSKKKKTLLFLSRIHPKKGLDILVKAWEKVSFKFDDWQLAIVGPDEGGHQLTIQKMIDDLNLNKNCKIYPEVNNIEKVFLFENSNLFVLPSYSEGFPMVLLEAAASRLPVIQTSECNFPELTEAHGSWTCEPTVNSLSKLLEEAMATDPKELKQRGALGRELVEKNYSWQKIAVQITNLCN